MSQQFITMNEFHLKQREKNPQYIVQIHLPSDAANYTASISFEYRTYFQNNYANCTVWQITLDFGACYLL